MKKLLVTSMVVALVAFTVPVWGQDATTGNTTSPLDGHCDVSLDGQVTFTKNVTITQTRDDIFKTNIDECGLTPKPGPTPKR